ncbi:MAG TPA: hypothetical protein VEB60_01135, partial [Candidatus Paceibacterota bacterium]|nr:hypothetical protein [Candidatus Paceibacterota bacterium]
MRILAIETSCDETGISIIDCKGGLEAPAFSVLAHAISSQIELHAQWGGVVPNLAKREHERNLIPVLKQALEEAGLEKPGAIALNEEEIKDCLVREQELASFFLAYIPTIEPPIIDAIAVTAGPGLEPALWTGINFARALSLAWRKPLIPVNHMEGHIVSPLLEPEASVAFPALALLVSGGHTELVLMREWLDYEVIGQTKDDAVGEAFDKVARMLDLPYPGGPQ